MKNMKNGEMKNGKNGLKNVKVEVKNPKKIEEIDVEAGEETEGLDEFEDTIDGLELDEGP